MPRRPRLKDNDSEVRQYRRRMALALVLVLVLMGVLAGRYATLQVWQHEQYSTQSERNRMLVQPVAPIRGLIYDRRGRLLAENVPSYTLTLTRERVRDLDSTLSLLTSLLSLSEEEIARFRQRLRQKRPFESVPLRFKLTDEEIALVAVNRHRLEGVEVEAQLVRHYPMGELMAPVLGYVGRISESDLRRLDDVENYAGTSHIGKNGLEAYYEAALHGRVGARHAEVNARGRVQRVLQEDAPAAGEDLHLHLDAVVQRVAFDALQGERGAVVAIDTLSGGVIAFVSSPSYDPNLFVRGIRQAEYEALRDSPDRPLFNRALQGQYPPGSTVKPVFALAGLDYGFVTPATRVADPGWYQLPNDSRRYHDWKRGGHGATVDLYQSMVESCDVYYYDLAYRLGVDRLHAFASRFGFGQRTGIDLPGEAAAIMPSREWKRAQLRQAWFPGETLSLGIGQGYMLATPLQLADATAMLANRGHRLRPRLVARVGEDVQATEWNDSLALRQPVHWDVIHRAMEGVIHSPRGTARLIAQGADYRMAGKTGTAQVVSIVRDEQGRAQAEAEKRRRDHALFIAYAPADAPRIAVGIIVENGEHGSSTAAPIARQVFDAYFQQEGSLPVPAVNGAGT